MSVGAMRDAVGRMAIRRVYDAVGRVEGASGCRRSRPLDERHLTVFPRFASKYHTRAAFIETRLCLFGGLIQRILS